MGKSEFIIPHPPLQLDKDVHVKSFSVESDRAYQLNLYRMTCSCPDFNKRNRLNYQPNDIRRMCKHLMLEYSQNVELSELSDFNRYAISNCLPIKNVFFDIFIETTNQKAFVSYWEVDAWWDIFIQDKNGKWNCYKYVPQENAFAYEEKPKGVVVILKKKLHNFYQWNHKRQKLIERQQKHKAAGCTPVLFSVLTIFLLLIKILSDN